MAITAGDTVSVEFTGRLTDGTVFDTSREAVAEESGLAGVQPDREYTPITIEVGAQRVIEGLERALIGVETGTTRTIRVPPKLAYGQRTEDRIREYGAEEFTDAVGGATPEEGAFIQTPDGALGEIVHLDAETVRIDFNHELAGEELEFEIEVLSVNAG